MLSLLFFTFTRNVPAGSPSGTGRPVAFSRIDRVAGALFAPYLAWVGFATYLNAGLWLLNR